MELKPCPFCGGDAKLMEMRYGDGRYSVFGVFCQNDSGAVQHGHFIDNYATEAEAVDAWNTRAERTCRIERRDCGDGVAGTYCSECGNHADEDDCYCPTCGARVVW